MMVIYLSLCKLLVILYFLGSIQHKSSDYFLLYNFTDYIRVYLLYTVTLPYNINLLHTILL